MVSVIALRIGLKTAAVSAIASATEQGRAMAFVTGLPIGRETEITFEIELATVPETATISGTALRTVLEATKE